MIKFYCEDVELPQFNQRVVKKVLKSEVELNGFTLGIVNCIFCSDPFLLNLNIKFLEHDYYTDVITFDYTEKGKISGDIYISIDMVRYNALNYGQGYNDELFRVISHGMLHLLNFNDKEKEEIELMRIKESELIFKIHSLID